MLKYITIAFFVSLLINFSIVFFAFKFSLGIDQLTNEPQKYHKNPTPRIGGLALFLGFLSVAVLLLFKRKESDFLLVCLSALPVFLVGFTEDLTRKIKPAIRLLGAVFSSILGIYLLGALLTRLDIAFLDSLLSIKLFAILVTVLAVSGVSNAFNIIDGYNGLASMVSIIIFFGLGYVAFKVNDMFLVEICFFMIFVILGFFLLNYPFGKIFMGDGGAYFIGFIVAEVSILLIERHKDVSAFFPLLVCIYPIFETIFSMYKRFIRKSSIVKADALHLHSLLHKRIIPVLLGSNKDLTLRNSATSPLLWFLTTISVIPAVIFWNNKDMLIVFSIVFILVYVLIYKGIVGFKLRKLIEFVKYK
jgi:UDP-N-acetylmuramyl pentapeptide phosphotransferase/UDP-N-acetylglucosamine-1-phosphate transferase